MPNVIAYAALIFWPIVALLLFKQIHHVRALIWTILGAYLILPASTAFDLPGIPPLDKSSIPNLAALVCCLLFTPEKWRIMPRDGIILALAAAFVVSPFFTALNNGAPIIRELRSLPPMTFYDALAGAGANIITLLPFLLGYGLVNTEKRRLWLLQALVIAGLLYSLPMLLEIRLSPQLHRWIYGFFPHSFQQQMRGDGFRPVVFLGHGLLVATFCAMSIIAAIALWRKRIGIWRLPAFLPPIYLGGLLILCKSVGALVLAIIIGGAAAFLKPRRLAQLSSLLCIFVLIYPLPRALGLVPVDTISQIAGSFSDERQGSFATRVINEDFLLERSAEKPIFGWGNWGRNRPSIEDTGVETITDGTWIIVVGTWGWVGYLAMFGLLSLPSLRLFGPTKSGEPITMINAGLMAIIAINLLDLISNSSLRPVTWLLAGVLAGITANNKIQKSGARQISSNQII
jgi:hypothetical protein